jgi:hypothetical protein
MDASFELKEYNVLFSCRDAFKEAYEAVIKGVWEQKGSRPIHLSLPGECMAGPACAGRACPRI